MATGRALIVGIRFVDSTAYGSEYRNGCYGAELDADNMDRVLGKLNYEISVLKTRDATRPALLAALQSGAVSTSAKDIFVLYFSGHGGQHPNEVEGDEERDGYDETLFAFDQPIKDDELADIWRTFPRGSRILMISDSCNSGTNFKLLPTLLHAPAPITLETVNDAPPAASLLHMGAAKDGFDAEGYAGGGAFTRSLCDTWRLGNFSGTYETLFSRIQQKVPSQFPQMNRWGSGADAFAGQRPFHIG